MGRLAQGYVPAAGPRSGHHDLCAVGRLYRDDFDDEDREWFDGVMEDDTQSVVYILNWLGKNGIVMSHSTLARHRRKACRCVRTQQGV